MEIYFLAIFLVIAIIAKNAIFIDNLNSDCYRKTIHATGFCTKKNYKKRLLDHKHFLVKSIMYNFQNHIKFNVYL